MPPKFHIRCDMEGVSGVVSMDQVIPGTPEYGEARRWFMAELLALIAGLQEGGAADISVYDEHYFGRNVDLAQIPSGVRVFCGKPPYRPKWAAGLEAGQAGLILHGLHSMEGTGHTLSHTYEPDFLAITLNGRPVGEIGLEAAVAGDFGVPLLLVIADSAGAQEAQDLVPGVATVTTKISHAYHGAECFPISDSLRSIRTTAARIASCPPSVEPYRPGTPLEMICRFRPGPYLEALRRRVPKNFSSPDTLVLQGLTTLAVWAEYWQLKLAVQAELSRRP